MRTETEPAHATANRIVTRDEGVAAVYQANPPRTKPPQPCAKRLRRLRSLSGAYQASHPEQRVETGSDAAAPHPFLRVRRGRRGAYADACASRGLRSRIGRRRGIRRVVHLALGEPDANQMIAT